MEKHIGVFKKTVVKRCYYLDGSYRFTYISYHDVKIREEEFYRCEILKPTLKIDEKIYLSELDEVVIIKDIIRTPTNDTVYYITHLKDIIEDEESLEQARRNKQAYEVLEKSIKLQESINKDKTLKRNWYEFWK